MILLVTISGLLATIFSLLKFIVILMLSYIVICLITYIIETLWIRRGYFYQIDYGREWFQKLGINKRLFLPSQCIGYVRKSIFSAGGKKKDNDIYIKTNFGPIKQGCVKTHDINENGEQEVIRINRKDAALVYSNFHFQTGSTSQGIPVGYVDEDGVVFEYQFQKDKNGNLVLGEDGYPIYILDRGGNKIAVEIGTCEAPRRIRFESEQAESEVFFRPIRKENKYMHMVNKQPVKDGTFRYFFWNDLLLWKRLYVYLSGEHSSQGWGLGHCRENGRWWPFGQEGAGIKLCLKAGAALLLYRKGYFSANGQEQGPGEQLGWYPTALISLLVYLLAWSKLWNWVFSMCLNDQLLFPKLGSMISSVMTMVLLFVLIWGIIHLIRRIVLQGTTLFDRFLHTMNCMTGVKELTVTILVLSLLGMVFTYFIEQFEYFSIFICMAASVIANMVAYKNNPWAITPFSRKEKMKQDREKKEQNHKSENDDKKEATNANDDDEAERNWVEREYDWETNLVLSSGVEKHHFSMKFNPEDIGKIRDENPTQYVAYDFSQILQYLYQNESAEVIKREKGDLHFYGSWAVEKLRSIVDTYVNLYDKAMVILSFVQDPNIEYWKDNESPELKEHFKDKENVDLLDYWRFPTESLFDKHGDCECKTILALYLCKKLLCTSKSKVDAVLLIMDSPERDNSHAALGLHFDEELSKLNGVDTVVTYNNKNYYFCECTGKGFEIGYCPSGYTVNQVLSVQD